MPCKPNTWGKQFPDLQYFRDMWEGFSHPRIMCWRVLASSSLWAVLQARELLCTLRRRSCWAEHSVRNTKRELCRTEIPARGLILYTQLWNEFTWSRHVLCCMGLKAKILTLVGDMCPRWEEMEQSKEWSWKQRSWNGEVGFAIFSSPGPRKDMMRNFCTGSLPLMELTSMKVFHRAWNSCQNLGMCLLLKPKGNNLILGF